MKRSTGFLALGLAAMAIGSIPASAQQGQGPAVAPLTAPLVDVRFLAECNGVRVYAVVGLGYTDENDAYRQLAALYPQCRFLQLSIPPAPLQRQ